MDTSGQAADAAGGHELTQSARVAVVRRLILDREFSYLELLLDLAAEEAHFVTRLNLGSHPPVMLSKTGQPKFAVVEWGATA